MGVGVDEGKITHGLPVTSTMGNKHLKKILLQKF